MTTYPRGKPRSVSRAGGTAIVAGIWTLIGGFLVGLALSMVRTTGNVRGYNFNSIRNMNTNLGVLSGAIFGVATIAIIFAIFWFIDAGGIYGSGPGHSWPRYFGYILGILMIIGGFLTLPFVGVISIIIGAVALYYLTRYESKMWFSSTYLTREVAPRRVEQRPVSARNEPPPSPAPQRDEV
jgi:hypothetical protein